MSLEHISQNRTRMCFRASYCAVNRAAATDYWNGDIA